LPPRAAAAAPGVFTQSLFRAARSLRLSYSRRPTVVSVPYTGHVMDIVYLALLGALIVLTWGFLRLCAVLEEHK